MKVNFYFTFKVWSLNPATKFHPDRNPGILAKKKFQEIHAAYVILMDPQKRETYDLMGMEGIEDRVCGAQGGKVKSEKEILVERS